MTLTIAKKRFKVTPNLVNNSIVTNEGSQGQNWRVENLTLGTKHELGIGTNSSDVNFNPITNRFGFVRNNFSTVTEIAEADIVAGLETPLIIRVLTINGLFNGDTEALSDVVPNLAEGGYEFWTGIEDGGRNLVYNVPYTLAEMQGTTALTVTARQELTVAPVAGVANRGLEGCDCNLVTQELISVQEGEASTVADKKVFTGQRPTDRDTDLDAAVDAGLTIVEPFVAQGLITGDLSSVCFHPATGHYLILSETGNALYQYDSSGTLISTLSGLDAELFQPEGICLHGDNMVIMGEVSEYCYCTYTAP